MTEVYTVSAIAPPNPPPKSEPAPKWINLPTDPATGLVPTYLEKYYFRLYGGSENNNDQMAMDWKSVQTAAYTKQNIAFDVN